MRQFPPAFLHIFALLVLVVPLAACMVGPTYSRPPVIQPDAFKSQPATTDGAAEASPITAEWWHLYREPALDRLIAMANDSNQTLQQAVAAVDQARALARVAGSFRFPTVSLDPSASRQRTSGTRQNAITGDPVQSGATIDDWIVPLDLSYEVDLWGRVRRSLQAARAQATASADDAAAVRLTVQASVAQSYYAIRSLDAQAGILAQTVASYREQVRLLSAQVRSGLASAIVLRQAEAQLESTLAQERDINRARADQEHALAILCGQAAPSFALAADPLLEATPPDVPPMLPATLLARRPDVASAEQLVVAANAQIGVATADFYPRFSLTSTAGFESANLSTLFDWRSRIASIIPGVTLPIFQGGRLKANLEATKAQYRQTVAAYTNQVLIAYGDVEDALTDLRALVEMVARYRAASNASRQYLHLAEVQFRTGLADYLIVIDAERTLLANQIALAQALNLQQAASIRLIRALGGGWEDR